MIRFALPLLAASFAFVPLPALAQDATQKDTLNRVLQRPLAGGGAVPASPVARPAPITPAEKLPQKIVTPLPQAVLVPAGKFNEPPRKFYAWKYKAEDAPAVAAIWQVPAAAPIYFAPGSLAQKAGPVVALKPASLRPEEAKARVDTNPVAAQVLDYTITKANAPVPPSAFVPIAVPDPFKNAREVQLRQPPPDLEGPAYVPGGPASAIKLPIPEPPMPAEKKP